MGKFLSVILILTFIGACRTGFTSRPDSVEMHDPIDPDNAGYFYFLVLEKETENEFLCVLMTDTPLEDLKKINKDKLSYSVGIGYKVFDQALESELQEEKITADHFKTLKEALAMIRQDNLHKVERSEDETYEDYDKRQKPYSDIIHAMVRLQEKNTKANKLCPAGFAMWKDGESSTGDL